MNKDRISARVLRESRKSRSILFRSLHHVGYKFGPVWGHLGESVASTVSGEAEPVINQVDPPVRLNKADPLKTLWSLSNCKR